MIVFNKKMNLIYHYVKSILFVKPFLKNASWRFIIVNPILITPKFIKIGNNVSIKNNSRIEGISAYEGTKYTPEIIIMNDVRIQQNLHLTCASKVSIGNYTAIAANVSITDINHGYEDITIPPEKQQLQVIDVSIGEWCKIYNNVIILPGTILGRQCIVGANAVVKGDFPDYCVIAGAPAKIVKRYNVLSQLWEKTDPKGNFIK